VRDSGGYAAGEYTGDVRVFAGAGELRGGTAAGAHINIASYGAIIDAWRFYEDNDHTGR